MRKECTRQYHQNQKVTDEEVANKLGAQTEGTGPKPAEESEHKQRMSINKGGKHHL
jgi:hypothetical protein